MSCPHGVEASYVLVAQCIGGNMMKKLFGITLLFVLMAFSVTTTYAAPGDTILDVNLHGGIPCAPPKVGFTQVAGTPPAAPYNTHCYQPAVAGGDFTVNTSAVGTLDCGEYTVTLGFAETWHGVPGGGGAGGGVGSRVFTINVEGVTPAASPLDVFATVGHSTPHEIVMTNVLVADGVLNIVLGRVAGDPMLSHLRVVQDTVEDPCPGPTAVSLDSFHLSSGSGSNNGFAPVAMLLLAAMSTVGFVYRRQRQID